MNEVLAGILLCILAIVFVWCISAGVNKSIMNSLIAQKKITKQILALLQNEQDKTDTLYRIIFHIRRELSLLKSKDCPEEEFKNIPFEIIDWIDKLEKINSGDEDGLHQ